ncbi:MAG: phosphoribosylamine--glycine ligase [Candidatus Nitrospinota bacterium M3_3B_026]
MNILVAGGGGRESALAWKISESPLVEKIYAAPGNAGTARVAENVPLGAEDVAGLVKLAKEKSIDLAVVGPEAPLVGGIVDAFQEAGLLAFGPSKKAAELEGSKIFMKELLREAGVPTARYEASVDRETAMAALDRFGEKVVVKADGLAAGKGVVVAGSRAEAEAAIDEMMTRKRFGEAGAKIILEEALEGEEASIMAFLDGENYIMMPSSQDHKRIGEGDTGPNTGGMGAYSPAPVITEEMGRWVEKNIIRKTLEAMEARGRPYRGVLYAGLMITEDGPKVLEFNCRFGDPECQPIMTRMESDIVPVLLACAKGDLSGVELSWSDKHAVCVVMASKGYPGQYEKGKVIHGLEEAEAMEGVSVFHAGTKLSEDGKVMTAGGRVLGVTAVGEAIQDAIDTVYAAVSRISWDGAVYRKDIGRRAVFR